MKLSKFLAGLALALSLPFAAQAADDYPSRPIRIVVAFPAGGVTDLASRIVAEALGKELNQSVIVENKAGGDGTVGLLEVVKAEPDGYTLLAGGFGGQLIPPLIKSNFPVDIQESLTLVARPTEFANVLVVNKDLPVNSVKEFMDYVKERPGELNFGSSGSATSDRLTTEMFMQHTGLKLTHVPYKGGAAALNDLAAGVIQVMFGNMPPALGLIQGGSLKPLAVTSPYRVPQLPDVPTMEEAGVEGFTMTSWNAIFAPKGLPEDIQNKLSDAIAKAVQRPETQEQLRKVGFEPVGEGSKEFQAFFAKERDRWKQVIDTAGLQN
ncbi:tripartite tricarboxylate transporter substrate binding protein [Chelativorans sp. J32]|mgnify:CR=1 FL=1|uniref:Bug family tripartite tricarboxylate transporter substrate binding protein n=1 Tax=Chelativorans sp. J32 TaxID=935840 RepID=UPI00048872CC|nr:tripartite tricarboxylate transporter substrate binding protein [Chelativorans sp. J32]